MYVERPGKSDTSNHLINWTYCYRHQNIRMTFPSPPLVKELQKTKKVIVETAQLLMQLAD
jgi:hypothetical protein